MLRLPTLITDLITVLSLSESLRVTSSNDPDLVFMRNLYYGQARCLKLIMFGSSLFQTDELGDFLISAGVPLVGDYYGFGTSRPGAFGPFQLWFLPFGSYCYTRLSWIGSAHDILP